MATRLYTKNGRPLQVGGDKVYSGRGVYLGRIRNGKVYDPNGRYAGTIVGDRVVYRTVDSAGIVGPSISMNRVATAQAPRIPAATWGDEPNFPD